MKVNKHNVFDKVVYSGGKYTSQLRGKIGVVVSRVQNDNASYVVEFGADAYVMHESVLDRAKTLSKDEDAKVEADYRTRRTLQRLED